MEATMGAGGGSELPLTSDNQPRTPSRSGILHGKLVLAPSQQV